MKVSYWLIPTVESKPVFEGIIAELATKFDAPVFEPHVTIYSGETDDAREASWVLNHLSLSPLVLETKGIGFEDVFTKSLFADFKPSEELQRLSNAIKAASKLPADYVLKPHLSLLYANVKLSLKQQVVMELNLPALRSRLPKLFFNEIKAVSTGVKTKSKQDVEGWRTLYAKTWI